MPKSKETNIEKALQRERDMSSIEALTGLVKADSKVEKVAEEMCKVRMSSLWDSIVLEADAAKA